MEETKPNEKISVDLEQPKEKVEVKTKEGKIFILKLFKYCGFIDFILLILGVIGSLGYGALQPMIMFFLGDMIDSYIYSDGLDNTSFEEVNKAIFATISDSVDAVIVKILLFGLGNMVAGFLKTFCFFVLSQRQGIKIRTLYFKSLLKQDAIWYDSQKVGELSSRFSSDLKSFQDGISIKFGMLLLLIAQIISGYILGFVKCWDLAFVVLATTPFSCLPLLISAIFMMKWIIKSIGIFGGAGAVAEETISNIKTVQYLSQEKEFYKLYSNKIKENDHLKSKSDNIFGLGLGILRFFTLASYTLAFWYGNLVIRGKGGSNNVTAGTVLIVYFGILLGSQAIAQISTPLTAVKTAQTSAFKIFETIDRKPDIDSHSKIGDKLDVCEGNVEFENVQFAYPTRQETKVLDELCLNVKKGETVALIGSSGCGKSTVIQLLQRMYDVDGGSIKLDGKEISELNINWLRNQIGLVGQEPVLFACSIRENIMLGAKDEEKPSEEQMIECAKMANAHDFISAMPQGYDTIIGEKGSQLSGGQKQRIAIARALIRNPKILLLDEATSALDSESEKIVQEALDKASQGRTTIIIAHRLSTIRNADKICVIDNGKIVEQGSHQELMDLKGSYHNSVTSEQKKERKQEKKQKEEEEKKVCETPSEETNIDDESVKRMKEEYDCERKRLEHSNRFASFRVVWNQLSSNCFTFIFGVLGSVISGAVYPFFVIPFINFIVMLMELKEGVDLTDHQKDTMIYSIIFLMVISIVSLFGDYCYYGLLQGSGEHLMGRIRIKLYKSILKQDVSWFDREENKSAVLSTKLSSEPDKLKGISGMALGNMIFILSTIGFGLGIALFFEWRIALCVIAIFPLYTLIFYANFKLNVMQSAPTEKAYAASGVTLVEALDSIRTIQSITKEKYFLEKFKENLRKTKKSIVKWSSILSCADAVSSFSVFAVNAYGFYLGTYFIEKKINYNQNVSSFVDDVLERFSNMQKAILCIIFAAQTIGSWSMLMPGLGEAISAAKYCHDIIDRRPLINNKKEDGDKIEHLNGKIEFKNVCFRYPTRPEHEVLKGVSFEVEQGKTVALVGTSGCGKSTIVQLLERFYESTKGEILIDSANIDLLNTRWLRNQIGMVGQEPVLFNESIMDNIRRGIPKGTEVTNEQIYEVCKMANAHDFISAMPEGYNTNCGSGGSQLSGGQKQRIAIARALIRNPKILLLDEATSALDSESEKIVQEALDKASQGRTTIIIAHRLSTIRNADKICVIDNGKIVEQGSHQELISLNGFYSVLTKKQTEEDKIEGDE